MLLRHAVPSAIDLTGTEPSGTHAFDAAAAATAAVNVTAAVTAVAAVEVAVGVAGLPRRPRDCDPRRRAPWRSLAVARPRGQRVFAIAAIAIASLGAVAIPTARRRV